jgi:malate dehydrogenase (oxaloacetate-decarboxylating)(NADP+)
VTIDVGTDNESLLADKFYLGNRLHRLKGEEYYQIIDEFLHAVYIRWPNVLVQFEDFNNEHALPLLEKYRNKYLCFNDDIQGTGAVALAGVICALRAQNLPPAALTEQRIVCLGAGSAGLGVCSSLVMGMEQEGLSQVSAHKQFWLVDRDGLVGRGRTSLTHAQMPFARDDLPNGMSLVDVIAKVKPTILLGLSGVGGTFTEEVIREMSKHCAKPIIFPLSNPTSKAECTAEQAYQWTDGTAIVASGSPFGPVQYKGKTLTPTQGNNMYIFPGLGLGIIASKSKRVTDSMFYAAAKTLAAWVPDR